MINDILGIDIGGVITKEALNDISKVVRDRFDYNVHIISRCSKEDEEYTLKWFDRHNFYNITGIERERIHFCSEHKEKADICKKLGITHFIDDRLEVLGYMHEAGIKNLYLFNPHYLEVKKFEVYLPKVQVVENWNELLSKI